MPIYEYQCAACGHKMEAIQNITAKPLKACPNCHKNQLQKLVSAAGFQLKGSGWYASDYSKQKNKAKKEEKEEGGTKASATETKTETASSAKTESKEGK
ncbi:MAG TPA: zinc ribbon domain-containing protein [Gammaproteobacteria bacterium]|nr:zinc ribbon domain-containing protein [Gammaproteobacteria bacterium]